MKLSYVLPIRTAQPRLELEPYLAGLARFVEVIVVDGSDPDVFDRHHAVLAPPVRHVAVDPTRVTAMGKVGGAMTGLHLASHDRVVIADDDVRYSLEDLEWMDDLLRRVDVVRPQNFFRPLPWHARWDTGRILLNRASGGDWPGTIGVRRSTLFRAGGYAGDVLFENLELERTVRAAGGSALCELGLLVERHPPTTAQFLEQRVRQAYDELARPWRLALFLSILPVVALTRARAAPPVVLASVALAEFGRRRAGGPRVFPPSSAVWAPLWVAERSVTSWLAVLQRLRYGGVRYRGSVLRRAATPYRELQARVRSSRFRSDEELATEH